MNPAGRDSVEPKLDLLGKSHGSTESRPAVHDGAVNWAEPHSEQKQYLDAADKKKMVTAQAAQAAQIHYGGKMTQGFSRLARRDEGEYP